jgi:hypothetical protein
VAVYYAPNQVYINGMTTMRVHVYPSCPFNDADFAIAVAQYSLPQFATLPHRPLASK